MAQGRSFFHDVKRELECSVCQEQFSEINEPKILKCLHTFCKSCLEAWLRQQREGAALSCPTCRQITECPNNNTNSLPSNLFCKQMVDIVEAYSGQGQEDSAPHCGSCDEKKSLKFYCSDCNCFLCEDCAGAHKKLKVLSGHHVKEIGNFESSDAQDYARRANVCKQHKDEVRFYCEQCVICICRDCAILEHRDHNIISLDKGLEKKKSEIENKMREVQTNGSRLRNQKDSLEKRRMRMNNSIEQATEEVNRVAKRNIELIRQHEASVTKQLIKQKETFQAEFSNTITGLDEKLMEIESSLDFGSLVLERNNLPEILNVEEVLEQRFQKLLEPSEFCMNLNYSEVKYVPNDFSSLKKPQGKLFTTDTEPSLSLAEGMGLTEGTQSEDCTFTVITMDSQNKKTYSKIDRVDVDIRSLQTGTALKAKITDTRDGCYKVSYKPEAAGEFDVLITVASEAINGSPFQLKVKESKLEGRKKGKRAESTVPNTFKDMYCSHEKDEPKCSMCMNLKKDPVYSSRCGHHFCEACRRTSIEKANICLLCTRDGRLNGNQPAGYMTWRTESHNSLPGYNDCGTIVIVYTFWKGIQGPEHPRPGQPYPDFSCTAYLPSNSTGLELCKMLRIAFDARLLFKMEKSPATGLENSIILNDIEQKTNRGGGPANYGYPDPGYLGRLKSQLAEKGIIQMHDDVTKV